MLAAVCSVDSAFVRCSSGAANVVISSVSLRIAKLQESPSLPSLLSLFHHTPVLLTHIMLMLSSSVHL